MSMVYSCQIVVSRPRLNRSHVKRQPFRATTSTVVFIGIPPVIPKIVAEIVSVEASSTDGFEESISTAWGLSAPYPNRAIDMENIAVEKLLFRPQFYQWGYWKFSLRLFIHQRNLNKIH